MKSKNISIKKGLIVSLISMIAFLVLSEIGLRVLLYQRYVPTSFALKHTVLIAKQRYNNWKLKNDLNDIKETIDVAYEELSSVTGIPYDRDPATLREELVQCLYSEPGQELLGVFQENYKNHFITFQKEVEKVNAKLIVLYIPMGRPEKESNICREFYKKIAIESGATYIDSTSRVSKYPSHYSYLVPENGHMSRFGNILVMEALLSSIEKNNDYRSNFSYSSYERPAVMGDKESRGSRVLNEIPNMVYKMVTNKQGFRMLKDLDFPKKYQRILFLGDSFTEGPFLANFNTYCGLLAKKYPEKDIINAGVGSYSIQDQKELFMEKAKYAEPDIVVLQVLDNDVSDMFYFYRNFNNRLKFDYGPSKEEMKFFKSVKKYNQKVVE